MFDASIGACILAAGKGTRMHSNRPKVLQELLQEPMLHYLYASLDPVFPDSVFSVIGFEAGQVQDAFPEREAASFILQAEQLGTGHALQCALPTLQERNLEYVLLVNGDTPLFTARHAKDFVQGCLDKKLDLGFLTLTLEDPGSFGRVLRRDNRAVGIIEAKDYDVALHGPEPKEINSGIYFFRLESIAPLLGRLQNENKSGEYYVTDLVALAVDAGLEVEGISGGSDPQLLGVNSPAELVEAEDFLRKQINASLLQQGVLIRQAESVRISMFAEIAPGVQITGPCEIYGRSVVDSGVVIESHCVIRSSEVQQGAHIKSFCHLEQAVVGPRCQVGPYARLRPAAVMEEDARAGNFVEIKKSVLGKGAKASHLTYLGDAEVGEGCNIGAGTITCNYDGQNKHRTVIGKGAFIGSNSALVAPVVVGDNALVAAGSVITEEVPPRAVAFGRSRQVNKER